MKSEKKTDTISSPSEISEDKISEKPLSIRNLSKVYQSDGQSLTVLSDINFDIEPGTIVGILGPNGAGKTTLIKSILDLVSPTTGEREIFGDSYQQRGSKIYKPVGAMFEGARNIYWRLTVRQNLHFFSQLNGENPSKYGSRFDTLLEQLNLTDKADTRVRKLSRGQKQKVSLATVLSGENKLVFLDEPTLGLDIESSLELRRELRRLVNREDLTVILSSHDMDIIEELCDRVIILNNGEIVKDESIEELLDVFETDLYDISTTDKVPNDVQQRLNQEYNIVSWSNSSNGTDFRVTLKDADLVHNLTGTIINAGVQLERVTVADNDLESKFISLINANLEDDTTKNLEVTGDDLRQGVVENA